MREAGLYLHTFASHLPFGMPISIGEAMASGAYVLARPCEGSREYLGNVGGFYDSVQEAAAFIRDTTTWSDARWSEAAREAAEWAYDRHADQRVLRPLLEDWQVLARRVRPISTPAPSRPVSDPGSPVINLPPVRIVKQRPSPVRDGSVIRSPGTIPRRNPSRALSSHPHGQPNVRSLSSRARKPPVSRDTKEAANGISQG